MCVRVLGQISKLHPQTLVAGWHGWQWKVRFWLHSLVCYSVMVTSEEVGRVKESWKLNYAVWHMRRSKLCHLLKHLSRHNIILAILHEHRCFLSVFISVTSVDPHFVQSASIAHKLGLAFQKGGGGVPGLVHTHQCRSSLNKTNYYTC